MKVVGRNRTLLAIVYLALGLELKAAAKGDLHVKQPERLLEGPRHEIPAQPGENSSSPLLLNSVHVGVEPGFTDNLIDKCFQVGEFVGSVRRVLYREKVLIAKTLRQG